MAANLKDVDLSKYPAVDITYKSAKENYSGQVAALMDKLANSKTSHKAKVMPPQDFKWSLVFNRAEDPPNITDNKAFTAYLCTNSGCWLKARGGGWKGYEEISVTPPQMRNNYEQRANLICQQRKRAEAGETGHDEDGRGDITKLLAESLIDAFDRFTSESGSGRLVAVARTALEMLIEDVLE